MAVTAYCPKCQYEFQAKRKSPGAPVKCEVCGGPVEIEGEEAVAKAAGKPARQPGQIRCPSCKKVLPPGVKFCARCNVHVSDAEGGVRGVAIVEGWKADEAAKKRKNILYELLRFFRIGPYVD